MSEHEALQATLAALQVEREEDFEQYKQLMQTIPLGERKTLGYSWYPVQVVRTGYALGDRAYIIVERLSEIDQPHQFRSGTAVNFFNAKPNEAMKEKSGIINFIDKNRMKIILNQSDFPEWTDSAFIGVDILFDERSYIEQEKAMNTVIKSEKNRLTELRKILTGKQEPRFDPITNPVRLPQLNDSQNFAVNSILAARDVAVVHGPPGTGKTTTIVQAIKLLHERESTVLVTAPSNAAVDLLTERLAQEGLNVVRIGNISRIDEDILRHTLDWILANHPESKTIKKVKIKAADCRRKAKRYSDRSYISREARKKLRDEASELSAWANDLEARLIDQILFQADVITCTLVGAAHPVLDKLKFKTVVIDEAAQALEPATWIPIIKSSKVVLAGDPFQLPPTVKSMEARKMGLHVTLIEKCLTHVPEVCLLMVQYRMHALIMGFSNQHFYDGLLQAHSSVEEHRLERDNGNPIAFIDTAGCGFEEKIIEIIGKHPSRYNPDEFFVLREHLLQLIEFYEDHPLPTIALISPYREQVVFMQNAIREDVLFKDLGITINTIDGFQGQERDVVYISLVRSNVKAEIGFLNDYRRMNVAMTRAKKKLVILGDSATIGNDRFYNAFLNYYEKENAYHTAWEFMA